MFPVAHLTASLTHTFAHQFRLVVHELRVLPLMAVSFFLDRPSGGACTKN
jgi:hypothetical protein